MFAVLPAGQFTPLQLSSSSEPLGIRDEVQLSCWCPTDGTVQISMVPQRSPWGPEKKPQGFISFFVLGQMMSIQCLLQILYKKSFLNFWILYKGWSAPQVKEYSSPVIFLLGWKTPKAPSVEQDFKKWQQGIKQHLTLSSIFYFLNYLALGWHKLGSQFSVPQALQCIYFLMPRSCLVAQGHSSYLKWILIVLSINFMGNKMSPHGKKRAL